MCERVVRVCASGPFFALCRRVRLGAMGLESLVLESKGLRCWRVRVMGVRE
jgi:hypothetical protein